MSGLAPTGARVDRGNVGTRGMSNVGCSESEREAAPRALADARYR